MKNPVLSKQIFNYIRQYSPKKELDINGTYTTNNGVCLANKVIKVGDFIFMPTDPEEVFIVVEVRRYINQASEFGVKLLRCKGQELLLWYFSSGSSYWFEHLLERK